MVGRISVHVVVLVIALSACMVGCAAQGSQKAPAGQAAVEMPAAQAAPEPAPSVTTPSGEAESAEPAPAGGAGVESETAEPAETGEGAAPHKATVTSRHVARVGATVTMGDRKFSPAKITVTVGESVRWKNSSKAAQSLTADSARAKLKGSASVPKGAKSFSSGDLKPGATYTHTFTVAGTYKYFCIQEEKKGMVGQVTVVNPKPAKTTARKTTAKKKSTASTK